MKRNDLFRGAYDIMILSCVKKNDSTLNKYRLTKKVNELMREYCQINESTIYDAIRRLKKNGYVLQNMDNNLSITKEGNDYLVMRIKEWNILIQIMQRFVD